MDQTIRREHMQSDGDDLRSDIDLPETAVLPPLDSHISAPPAGVQNGQVSSPNLSQPPGHIASALASLQAGAPDAREHSPLKLVIPPRPQNVAETHLQPELIEDLALKHIVTAGAITGSELADRLCLPLVGIVEDAVNALRREGLIDHVTASATMLGVAAMKLRPTERGAKLERELRVRTSYVGPAPVPWAAFEALLRHQTKATRTVRRADVWRRLSHLVLSDDTVDLIGAGLESGGPILLFGPSGNGKTAIATSLVRMLAGGVFVPHAVDIEGQIVRVYDPGVHQPLNYDALGSHGQPDARWVFCRIPFVRVGADLTAQQLELNYNEYNRYYDAPVQVKAAGGVLFVDDLGEQQLRADDLLNRLLGPAQSNVEYLTLADGRRLPVPFTSLLVFATSHQPNQLVRSELLRRLACKIPVSAPTEQQFREIFRRACEQAGVEFTESGFRYFLDRCYAATGRTPCAGHPAEMLRLIAAAARYAGAPPQLTPQLIDVAAELYFA
jgi:hypothetical protein